MQKLNNNKIQKIKCGFLTKEEATLDTKIYNLSSVDVDTRWTQTNFLAFFDVMQILKPLIYQCFPQHCLYFLPLPQGVIIHHYYSTSQHLTTSANACKVSGYKDYIILLSLITF